MANRFDKYRVTEEPQNRFARYVAEEPQNRFARYTQGEPMGGEESEAYFKKVMASPEAQAARAYEGEGLEAPWVDPIDAIAGPVGLTRKYGVKALRTIPAALLAEPVQGQAVEALEEKTGELPAYAQVPLNLATSMLVGGLTEAGIQKATRGLAERGQQAARKAIAPGLEDAEAVATREAMQSPRLNEEAIDRVRKTIRQTETPTLRKKAKEAAKGVRRNFYEQTVDDLISLERNVRDLIGDEAYDALPISQNPYQLARIQRGSSGLAETFLYHRPFRYGQAGAGEYTGEGLQTILKDVEDLGEFSTFLKARRDIEFQSRDLETGTDFDDISKVHDDLAPKYQEAASRLSAYQDHLLKYLKDSGFVSAEQYEKMKLANGAYVPFRRVFEGEEGMAPGRGTRRKPGQPMKKVKGSEREIYDPIESIIQNTYQFTELATRNRTLKALTDLVDTPGMEGVIVPVKGKTKGTKFKLGDIKNEEVKQFVKENGLEEQAETLFRREPFVFDKENNIVQVWKDGKREYFEIKDPEIIRALEKEKLPAHLQGALNLFGAPSRLLRAGATLAPEFVVKNMLRDQAAAAMFSRHGYIPFFDFGRGLASRIKRDDLYWDWLRSGGANSMLVSLDRAELGRNLQEVAGKVTPSGRGGVGNVIEGLRRLSEGAEVGTRLGEFGRAVRRGEGGEEDLLRAALDSRDVTLDFARAGQTGRAWNQLSAFANARIQGLDKVLRELTPGRMVNGKFKYDPKKAKRALEVSGRGAAVITTPSLALYFMQRDDPRYDMVPPEVKENFWVYLPGEMTHEQWDGMTAEEKARYMRQHPPARIPKPQDVSLPFSNAPEMFLEYVRTEDPDAWQLFKENVLQDFASNLAPTGAIPIAETQLIGKSLYSGRPIIPMRQEDLADRYQAGPNTSPLLKAFAEGLGSATGGRIDVSPANLEHMISGYTGTLGRYALNIADAGASVLGLGADAPEKPAATLSDLPFIRSFVVRMPSAGNKHVGEFFNNVDEISEAYKTYKSLLMKDRGEEAEEFLQGRLEQAAMYPAMVKLQKKLGGMFAYGRQIQQDREDSPEKKRQELDELYIMISEVTQTFNNEYRKIKGRKANDNRDSE